MPKPNHSFSTYLMWEIIPVLPLAIFAMFSPLVWQILQCVPGCNEKKVTKLLHKAAKAVFGPPLGVFSFERNTATDIIYLKGKVVPKPVLGLLGYYAIISVTLILIVFWEIFLIHVSFACNDTTIDCFVSNSSVPITDCGLYEKIDNAGTVVFYICVPLWCSPVSSRWNDHCH